MDPHMEELYNQVCAFEDGELYRTEYVDVRKAWMSHFNRLHGLLESRLDKELTDFFRAIDSEWELYCKHFFMEGYQIGLEDGKKEGK